MKMFKKKDGLRFRRHWIRLYKDPDFKEKDWIVRNVHRVRRLIKKHHL